MAIDSLERGVKITVANAQLSPVALFILDNTVHGGASRAAQRTIVLKGCVHAEMQEEKERPRGHQTTGPNHSQHTYKNSLNCTWFFYERNHKYTGVHVDTARCIQVHYYTF
jgi:hypothetical protein